MLLSSKEIHQINSYLNQSLTFTRRFDKGGWEGGRYYGTCAHALKGEEHTWNYKAKTKVEVLHRRKALPSPTSVLPCE